MFSTFSASPISSKKKERLALARALEDRERLSSGVARPCLAVRQFGPALSIPTDALARPGDCFLVRGSDR
jgi:hypothetical protein